MFSLINNSDDLMIVRNKLKRKRFVYCFFIAVIVFLTAFGPKPDEEKEPEPPEPFEYTED